MLIICKLYFTFLRVSKVPIICYILLVKLKRLLITVIEMKEELEKLIAEGKGEYRVEFGDGYGSGGPAECLDVTEGKFPHVTITCFY